jgi:hypothetical protein
MQKRYRQTKSNKSRNKSRNNKNHYKTKKIRMNKKHSKYNNSNTYKRNKRNKKYKTKHNRGSNKKYYKINLLGFRGGSGNMGASNGLKLQVPPMVVDNIGNPQKNAFLKVQQQNEMQNNINNSIHNTSLTSELNNIQLGGNDTKSSLLVPSLNTGVTPSPMNSKLSSINSNLQASSNSEYDACVDPANCQVQTQTGGFRWKYHIKNNKRRYKKRRSHKY